MFPQENLEYVYNLISDLFKIPLTYFNDRGEIEYKSSSISSPIGSTETLIERLKTNKSTDFRSPILMSTLLLENFLSIAVEQGSNQSGVLLLGPSTYGPISDETIKGLKNDLQLTIEESQLKEYFYSLSVTPKTTLLNIGKLTYYLLYQKELDIMDIVEQQKETAQSEFEIENADLLLSTNRLDQHFHHSYLFEKEIFSCITEGNKEALFVKIQTGLEKGQLGILSKRSHIRSQKNLAISGITLATRAAMEGGLGPEVAYTLSDLYIQTLEDTETIHQIDLLQAEAYGELADRVKKTKQKKYSKPVNTCVNYISSHLYDDITLMKLAALTDLSQGHLSKLFKSEVGTPISLFIQHERIEEAKKLLVFSNYSLTEIYSRLNFNDQSYFTKTFKKVTGQTPAEFRKSGL